MNRLPKKPQLLFPKKELLQRLTNTFDWVSPCLSYMLLYLRSRETADLLNVVEVPKHVLDQACRQKRWETTPSQLPDDSELSDLNLCPQNDQHLIVADSPNVLSPKSNDDASGEDNSSVEGEKSGEDGEFDFEQAENDPPPSLPPPLSSPPVADDDPVSHLESRANGVAIVNINHSRLQEMFKLDSEEADMARCILEVCLSIAALG
jgi:hypothetical protein